MFSSQGKKSSPEREKTNVRMRVQESNNATVVNGLRTYGNRTEAIILIASGEKDTNEALARVFILQEAPFVDPETELPWGKPSVGDCRIGDNGVLFTVEGSGASFMGLRFEASWGQTSADWASCAERSGRVWLGLTGPIYCERILREGEGTLLPRMRFLRLDVVR